MAPAMPGPVGANPSFTIAAFADRVAEAVLDGRPGSLTAAPTCASAGT